MYECRVQKVFSKLCRALAFIGGIALTAMLIVIVANIVMRRFFNISILGSTEIVSYLSLFIGSIGLGHQEWIKGNITMTILPDSVKPRTSALIHAIISFICFAGFSVVSYYLTNEAIKKAIVGELSSTLHIPLVIPTGFMAACFIFLSINLAVMGILYVMGYIKNDWSKYGTEQSEIDDMATN